MRCKVRIYQLANFVLLMLLVACSPSIPREAASSPGEPETVVTSTATRTPTAQPTATMTPTMTPSPTLTLTPTVTPTHPPPLTWENPWTGETLSIPPRCLEPDVQGFIAWVQQHPVKLADAMGANQTNILDDAVEVEGIGRGDEWFKPSLVVTGLEEDPPTPALVVRFPAVLVGIARRHDYPELGLTVFTACALVWDNDLAERVDSWEAAAAYRTDEQMRHLLTRKDMAQIQRHWYLSEVPVAYVLWPQGRLSSLPTVTGVKPLKAWGVISLSPGGGSSYSHGVSYKVTWEPGCYYPYQPRGVSAREWEKAWEEGVEEGRKIQSSFLPQEDPSCQRLGSILSGYNQWLGEALVEIVPLPKAKVQGTHFVFEPLDEVNYDVYVKSWPTSNVSVLAQESRFWVQTYFEQLQLRTSADELGFVNRTGYYERQARIFALAHLLESWEGAQRGGEQACIAMRALAQYKIPPESLAVACPLEETLAQDLLPTNLVLNYDGDMMSGLELSLDAFVAWAQKKR